MTQAARKALCPGRTESRKDPPTYSAPSVPRRHQLPAAGALLYCIAAKISAYLAGLAGY